MEKIIIEDDGLKNFQIRQLCTNIFFCQQYLNPPIALRALKFSCQAQDNFYRIFFFLGKVSIEKKSLLLKFHSFLTS